MRFSYLASVSLVFLTTGCAPVKAPEVPAHADHQTSRSAQLASASSSPPSGPLAQAADTASSAGPNGKEIYTKYCELCHGEDGIGNKADHAPQLRNPLFLATASDEFLATAIQRGVPGTSMSGFHVEVGGPLNDDEVDALMAYIRSLKLPDLDKVVVAGSPKAGEKIYRESCAGCHGASGEGQSAPSLNSPYFLATASDGYLRYAIEYGRPGTPMDGFRGRLTPGQLDDVTLYLRSLTRTVEQTSGDGEAMPTPDRIILNPRGPQPDFPPLREGRYLPAKALNAALAAGVRIVLLDARPPSDWIMSHIVGAYPSPFYGLNEQFMAQLPRDGTWIVAYCGCPHAASGRVMDKLRENGFRNTAVLDEGVFEWARMKFPTTFGRAK